MGTVYQDSWGHKKVGLLLGSTYRQLVVAKVAKISGAIFVSPGRTYSSWAIQLDAALSTRLPLSAYITVSSSLL